ncbi:hypothetical protein B0H17DRAFT_1147404 [Mycena rosella]|uniref:Uncharacterized protein n=1 Tax=Mycena rosella TaxID=1033263 RepID=A0AAD7CLQ0_MYCRO|nr:hypothetical protein B0H17DRAFT_1147404 [Mycena rosella]
MASCRARMNFLFKARNGSMQNCATETWFGIVWVTLNGTFDDLPASAMNFIYSTVYHSPRGPMDEYGYLPTIEWYCYPDWFDQAHFWRAWIPKPSTSLRDVGVLPLLWYFEFDVSGFILFRPEFNNYVIAGDHHERFTQDLTLAYECIQSILGLRYLPALTPMPECFNLDLLLRANERIETYILVIRAKRAMLGRASVHILGGPETVTVWSEGLDPIIAERMKGYFLGGFDKRGVILNVARDWRSVNIASLIAYDAVPLFVPLVKIVRTRVGRGKKNGPDWKGYIIDCKYWRARAVSNSWRNAFIWKYHYKVLGDLAQSNATIIFYRYRPQAIGTEKEAYFIKDPSFLQQSASEVGDEPDEDMVSLGDEIENDPEEQLDTRNLFAPSCAPKPGQIFDEVSGMERTAPYVGLIQALHYLARIKDHTSQIRSDQYRSWENGSIDQIIIMSQNEMTQMGKHAANMRRVYKDP